MTAAAAAASVSKLHYHFCKRTKSRFALGVWMFSGSSNAFSQWKCACFRHVNDWVKLQIKLIFFAELLCQRCFGMPNGDLFLLVEVLIKVPSTLAIHLGDDTYESCKRTPCPVSRWKTRTANEILVRDAMYFNTSSWTWNYTRCWDVVIIKLDRPLRQANQRNAYWRRNNQLQSPIMVTHSQLTTRGVSEKNRSIFFCLSYL